MNPLIPYKNHKIQKKQSIITKFHLSFLYLAILYSLPTLANNQTIQPINNFNQPIATFDKQNPILGYDKQIDQQAENLNQLPNLTEKQKNTISNTNNILITDNINPEDYLPTYQNQPTITIEETNPKTTTKKSISLTKKITNKLLKREENTKRIKVTIKNFNEEKQPALNIKSALEEITTEAVSDFKASLPRLQQIAKEASKAVGYYETSFSFQKIDNENIQVTITKIGEPIKVTSRIIDIRGEATTDTQTSSEFKKLKETLPPKENDIFNHGTYQQSKAKIENTAKAYGFFDSQWLNSSVDIILPDNTAEIDLIYDTKQRYQFDNIKIYTINKEGKLTDNPNELPIKKELLEKLMTYQENDKYFQPLITKLSNNLQATRYFNTVDIDIIMPPENINSQTTLSFNNQTQTENTANTENNPSNIQNQQDIAPLEFDIDEDITTRLNAVKQKSQRLLQAPEDIQLAPDDENTSKNPLVIIANSISKIAKKIDKKENSIDLLNNSAPSELIEKQTAEQVYQNKSIPTYIILNANKTKEAQIGLGYETDKGFRIIGKLNNNLLNRHGHQVGTTIGISEADKIIEFTGKIPYKHPLNNYITGSISYENKNVDDVNNVFQTDTLRAGIANHIKKETGWNRIISLRYRYDKLDNNAIYEDQLKLPPPFNNYASNFTQQALLLGYAMNKTTVDNTLNPTRGYRQFYSIEVGSDDLLTDTNMAIFRAGLSGIYSFGRNNKHQLLGRGDLGYIYSDNFTDVPYKLRFFAGGDQSIRGYATDSQGPKYQNADFLLGGDILAIGSLEYNYQFRDGWRAALFTDFGNAYQLHGEDTNSTKVGIGTGVRWASPIGIVRLDVAVGVSDDDKPVKLYFFIGSPM